MIGQDPSAAQEVAAQRHPDGHAAWRRRKVVQQMLGHASATMTLDTYGHLFEDRLDEVGDALDRAREAVRQRRELLPRVAPVLPEPDFDGNEEAARPSVSAGQDRFSEWYPRPDSNRRYRLERAAC